MAEELVPIAFRRDRKVERDENGDGIEELFLPQEEDRVGDRKWEITEKSIPKSLETR